MFTKSLAVVLFVIFSIPPSNSIYPANFPPGLSDEAKAKQLLTKTYQEVTSAKTVNANLLAEICALQLQLDDQNSAVLTLAALMARTPDGGGYAGPLNKLCGLIRKSAKPKKFQSLIQFFKSQNLGIEPDRSSTEQLDNLVVNLIAKAAGQREFQIAEQLLNQLSVTPENFNGSGERSAPIQAALWINLPLAKDGKVEEMFRIAKLYKKDLSRAAVYRHIFEITGYDPKIEEKISGLLKGVNPEAETVWCRLRFNHAMGRIISIPQKDRKVDIDKATSILKRMTELGVADISYNNLLVARELRKRGKESEARALLDAAETIIEPGTDIPNFKEQMLSEEIGESGDIDKAIALSAHWSRFEFKSSYRLATYKQPLCDLAVDLAKKGELEEASRVAFAIKDNYWRTATLNKIGARMARKKDKSTFLEYSKLAREAAASISPIEHQQTALASIVTVRAEYLDLSFEDILKEIKPLTPWSQSRILGSRMEFLMRDNLPIENVKQAISIIEAGDTMSLHTTAEILLDQGHIELAAKTIVKIELEYEFEFYLHNFFTKARKNWSLVEQFEFIATAQFREQPALALMALNGALGKDRDWASTKALKILKASGSGLEFEMQLMKTLFDEFATKKNYGQMKELLTIQLAEPFQIAEMSAKVEKLAVQTIAQDGEQAFAEWEKALATDWCRAAILRSRIKSDLVTQKIDSALARIETFPDVNQRARFRLQVVEAIMKDIAEQPE